MQRLLWHSAIRSLCLAGILLPSLVLAAGPVDINADQLSYDAASGVYTADGQVRMKMDEATLTGDRATVNEQTGMAEVTGRVRLTQGGDLLEGERMDVDVRSGTGTLTPARLTQRPGPLRMKAASLSRTGPESYHTERGSFTTCDADPPAWKFTASDLDVTVDGYATGTHALFYIYDVPVLYFPYIVFPTLRERQSGFLMPRFGNSSKKGFTALVPYYWAISPSQEATVSLDFQSKRGTGGLLDYRYLRSQGSEGALGGMLFYDKDQSQGRGLLNQRHFEELPDGWQFRSELHLVTDKDVFRDFGEASGEYNRQQLVSRAFVEKNWSSLSLVTEFDYLRNLDIPDNDVTLQRLPTVMLTGFRQGIGRTPLAYGYDVVYDNFARPDGVRGSRLDLRPYLSLASQLPGGFDLTMQGGYRARLYDVNNDPTVNGSHGSFLPDASINLSTAYSRVYEVGGGQGLTRLQHRLVPEVGYRWVDEEDQQHLPFFDHNDRLVHYDMLTYGLSSILTGRFDGGAAGPVYRDLLYLRISQGYELGGTRNDLLTLYDPMHRTSDLRIEARGEPLQNMQYRLDARYDANNGRLSTFDSFFDYRWLAGNQGSIGYHFARDTEDYLEARLGFNLLRPFRFNYLTRYSFQEQRTLESLYTVEYRQQCWSIIFNYRVRPDSNDFTFNIVLHGLDQIGGRKTTTPLTLAGSPLPADPADPQQGVLP